ncbi:hypothetical protein QYE76_036280 [Lolium multiflorum]|uniref:Terpene synthase metal-binding domain-containing protein n=1 Tax=Lolium multiflorum TaxID=4521 RepID=A0AAD8R1P4_LOLMU|nr:hypothetical protein QYE76_036280 [Lolium multiflorum]
MNGSLESPLAEQVKRSLHLPLQRTYRRMEAVYYISEYKQEEDYTPALLELATLDFNLLQYVHLKELKAITRWDVSAVSLLPEYLKNFYNELLRNINEFGSEMEINGNSEIAYIKKAFQNQFIYYLQEVEWSHKNHKPSFEDLVNLTSMSIGVSTVFVCFVVGMGDAIPKEALEWVAGFPDVVMASAKIARFMNDIAALKVRML